MAFLKFNSLGIGLKFLLLILGIVYLGLLGAALSGVVILCYRNIVGYILVHKDSKTRLAEAYPK
jgi:hypothetical protein